MGRSTDWAEGLVARTLRDEHPRAARLTARLLVISFTCLAVAAALVVGAVILVIVLLV
jgi:hypothetical protein